MPGRDNVCRDRERFRVGGHVGGDPGGEESVDPENEKNERKLSATRRKDREMKGRRRTAWRREHCRNCGKGREGGAKMVRTQSREVTKEERRTEARRG